MRLVDADILITELKESALHHCNNSREDSLLQRDRVIVRAQPTVDAIVIPDNATNGDVIKAMFPNVKTWIVNKDMAVEFSDMLTIRLFPLAWWNLPWKKEKI